MKPSTSNLFVHFHNLCRPYRADVSGEKPAELHLDQTSGGAGQWAGHWAWSAGRGFMVINVLLIYVC